MNTGAQAQGYRHRPTVTVNGSNVDCTTCPATRTIDIKPRRSGRDGAPNCWRPQHRPLSAPALNNGGAQHHSQPSPASRAASSVCFFAASSFPTGSYGLTRALAIVSAFGHRPSIAREPARAILTRTTSTVLSPAFIASRSAVASPVLTKPASIRRFKPWAWTSSSPH